MNINYKTYNDLSSDIKRNLSKIPADIDMIVGIPRSGMIPAYMIGLALNKPVCSIREFISGDFKINVKSTVRVKLTDEIKNILIIDDSINTGNAMNIIRNAIANAKLDKQYNIKYAAVYYKPGVEKMIDIVLAPLPQPRVFQWNYLNHSFLKNAALDIDGVLCMDPTPAENDDGEKYLNFLKNARPCFIPQYKVAALVTSRLGKYRKETEEWMKKHNVQYENLYMLENVSAEQRRSQNLHAKHKANVYKQLKNVNVFIESDRNQAREIARLTGKMCFCSTTDELFVSEFIHKNQKNAAYFLRRILACLCPFRKLRHKIRHG